MTSAPSPVDIVRADLDRPEHRLAVVELTNAYAEDPLGNGAPLAPEVLDRLMTGLRETPTAMIWLAYVDGRPAGIATCFRGFSTFQARPLINVHDLSVRPEYRARGIGRALLRAVADEARRIGCCRVTLEVQAENVPARRLYEQEGFAHALATTAAGGALFYTKHL